MATPRYDDSPQRLDEYVTIDEVDALLGDDGKYLAKDHRRTAHFLHRVRLTLVGVRTQIQNLHRDVQAAQIRATSIGTPTTLDPRSAAKFLPPEELAQLGDELLRQKFEALAEADAENRETRAALLRKVNALKFAVSTIVEDYSLPEDVREKVNAAFATQLAQYPDEPAPVEQPTPPPTPTAPPPVADSLDDLFA